MLRAAKARQPKGWAARQVLQEGIATRGDGLREAIPEPHPEGFKTLQLAFLLGADAGLDGGIKFRPFGRS